MPKKIFSNYKYNEKKNEAKLLEYLSNNQSVAVVSDRGTPVISDPGYELARLTIEAGYNVVGLPGATAFVPALIMSGLKPQPFLFYGFLINKSSKRKEELEMIKDIDSTIIFYEAPHRLLETLNDIKDIFGNRKISIAREISKKFEEVYRGNILEVIEELDVPKGEFVIIVDGNHEKDNYSDINVNEHVNIYIREGYSVMAAIKKVAKDRNVSKNDIYSIYHNTFSFKSKDLFSIFLAFNFPSDLNQDSLKLEPPLANNKASTFKLFACNLPCICAVFIELFSEINMSTNPQVSRKLVRKEPFGDIEILVFSCLSLLILILSLKIKT